MRSGTVSSYQNREGKGDLSSYGRIRDPETRKPTVHRGQPSLDRARSERFHRCERKPFHHERNNGFDRVGSCLHWRALCGIGYGRLYREAALQDLRDTRRKIRIFGRTALRTDRSSRHSESWRTLSRLQAHPSCRPRERRRFDTAPRTHGRRVRFVKSLSEFSNPPRA